MKKIVYAILLFSCYSSYFCANVNASTVSYYIYESPSKSVEAMVSGNNVVNTYRYDSFGTTIAVTKNIPNSYTYVGEYVDFESGLVYLRNRYYSPDIGRFTTKDFFPGLGVKPQTINPYVYVENNPINRIDPLGLLEWDEIGDAIWSFIRGDKMPEALPGESYKEYRERFKTEYTEQFALADAFGITGLATLATDQAIDKGLNYAADVSVSLAKKSLTSFGSGNFWYIHGWDKYMQLMQVSQGLKVGAVASGVITAFATAYRGGLELNCGIRYLTTTPEKIFKGGWPEFTSTAYAAEISPSNFGGVSLSKTAQFLLDLSEVKGAVYDDKTGQIILVGKQNLSLPQMKLPDLSVAANSVYAGTDPGVSIDPPLVHNHFSVRYDGKTSNTEFGWVMFESDRIMKTLALGKDNITGAPVTSNVTGYKNMLERYRESDQIPEGESSNRFWFKPKEMKLVKSADGNSMVFDSAIMEVLTESKYQDNVVGDAQAEGFAANLTQYYDDYANQFAILKDLKRLGQVVAIVKWLKDNDIPIDLSFISNYSVPVYNTPANTPATQVYTEWQDGNIKHTFTITGGVTYTKPNEYLTDSFNVTNPLKDAAISQRPSETEFKWNFTSNQSEALTAVAESFARMRKDGNLKFSAVDLNYPADCSFPLEFSRYYDSFYDKDSAFGYGWECLPYQLRFPENKRKFTFGSSGLILSLYPQVFVANRPAGQEDTYELLGIDSANLPLYAKSGQTNLLREISNGNFVLTLPDSSAITFNSQGSLLSLSDKNAKAITYSYTNGRLSAISAGAAGSINIAYNGDNIISVTGPGPRTINYGFLNGNLTSVTNAESQSTTYDYDSDHRVKSIADARGNLVFTGTYDDYNRLSTYQVNNELDFGRDFSLNQRKTIETDPNTNNTIKNYDDKFRVVEQKDYLGNKVNISYNADNGPEQVTDAKGQSTKYTYDVHGNVSTVTTADETKVRMFYDLRDNLVAVDNPDSNAADTAYGYDDKNRLTTIYHYAILNFDTQGNLIGWQHDTTNLTTMDYDQATGRLRSITDGESRKQTFEDFTTAGIPKVIKSTSGFAITNDYDSFGRLKSVSDPAQNSISFGYTKADQLETITTSAGQTSFNYDKNNNVERVTDARQNPTLFGYDQKNNLDTVTDAEEGLTAYTYDKFNNLENVTLPNTTKFAYEFDDLNRMVVAKSGMGTPMSVIAILEDTVDIGTAVLGYSSTKTLHIYNLGTRDLQISGMSVNQPVFGLSSTAAVISQGEDYSLTITFTPSSEGTVNGALSINSDDADTPTITMTVSAKGQLEPLIQTAHSIDTGIQINWHPISSQAGKFKNYAIYRSGSPITNLYGMIPIATISSSFTSYTDTTAVMNTSYYYTVVALDAEGNRLTAVISYGPVSYLNIGRLGSPTVINEGYGEGASSLIYNPVTKEYLLIYEADPSEATNYDIYGQRISNTGQKIGFPFGILDSGNNERNPRIAYNSVNNEYLVVAEVDFSTNGTNWHAIGQRVSAGGTKTGDWFYVFRTNTQENKPRIAYNSTDNNYMVVFEYNRNGDGSRWDIAKCVLSANGSIIISPNALSSTDSNIQLHSPSITYNNLWNQFLCLFERRILNLSKNDICYALITANNVTIGGDNLTAPFTPPYSSYLPKAVYNPDRDEYICVWHYNIRRDSSETGLWVGGIAGYGGQFAWNIYSIPNKNVISSEICYYKGHNEYLISFTTNTKGTNALNVEAQRISTFPLDFITDLEKLIPIADSSSIERNNCVVYNPDKNEFLSGYEFDSDGAGINLDLKLQRIGLLTLALSANPVSLDFGAATTSKTLQVVNSGGAPMLLNAVTNQPWLSVTPSSVNQSGLTADFTVNVSRDGLSPNNYQGNVSISFAGGVINVPVAMAVTAQPPQAPSNPLPATGAVNQKDLGAALTVTMGWVCADSDPGDTITYDVYFSEDVNKVTNLDSSCLVMSNQVQNSYKSGALKYIKTYYWRVKAKDSHGLTTVGPVWSFTTANINKPQLIPYSPDPSKNKTPTLSWSAVEGANKYHLQVSKQADFSTLLLNDTNISGTNYTFNSDLSDGKFYWRVSSLIVSPVDTIDYSTKLLLHANGAEGSQQFTDSSAYSHPVTVGGSAKITTTQSRFGGASAAFNGTTDYLTVSNPSDWSFGTGDFTIDFWVMFNTIQSCQFFGQGEDSANRWELVYLLPSSKLTFFANDDGNEKIYGSTTEKWSPSINTWYHIACVRNGVNFYIFIDGFPQAITFTTSPGNNDLGNHSADLAIGRRNWNSSLYVNGTIDEFRVSKGIARWTSKFSWPTQEYSIHSTQDTIISESDFSTPDDFTIQTALPQAPTLIPYSPNPTREQKPFLSWVEVEGAVSYHIQISQSSTFDNLIADKYVTTVNYTLENNLPEGLIYWRASTKDAAGNESAFSSYSSFVIDITAPAKITGLTATTSSEKITLGWDYFSGAGSDFSHFNVYRANSAISNVSGMTPIAEISNSSATGFVDTIVAQDAKYYYAVTAEDMLGNEDKSVTGIGPVIAQNNAPVLERIEDKAINEGQLLEFTISASDPDFDLLTYSIVGLPQGAYFNPTTGLFSYLPNYDQQGTYPVTFKVSDSQIEDTQRITITVNNVYPGSKSGQSVGITLKVRVLP